MRSQQRMQLYITGMYMTRDLYNVEGKDAYNPLHVKENNYILSINNISIMYQEKNT